MVPTSRPMSSDVGDDDELHDDPRFDEWGLSVSPELVHISIANENATRAARERRMREKSVQFARYYGASGKTIRDMFS